MKTERISIILPIVFFLLNFFIGVDIWSSLALVLFVFQLYTFFVNLNTTIAFKEFIIVLYGLNYLFSPAILYNYGGDYHDYNLKIAPDEFFPITISSLILMQIGMNVFKTKINDIDFSLLRFNTLINVQLFKQWFYIGIALTFINPFLPQELGFLAYLLSGIKYIAAFGLFAIDKKKYYLYLIAVFFFEILASLRMGMFGEFVMWVVMFGIFFCFLVKPSELKIIYASLIAVFLLFVLQISKGDFREQTYSGKQEASFSTLKNSAFKNINNKDAFLGKGNITDALFRINQGWILSSTINRMNSIGDYQQLTLVNQYLEAAFLPRFFSPDKLKAGDKQIFNRFSGHTISGNTSMGLGILADGYIAFGFYGVLLFAFIFGVIISLIFKIVFNWAKISPFFILFAFPILNYAARPDCETQTLIGHLVKGTFVFALMMWYYEGFFIKKLKTFEKLKWLQERKEAAIKNNRIIPTAS